MTQKWRGILTWSQAVLISCSSSLVSNNNQVAKGAQRARVACFSSYYRSGLSFFSESRRGRLPDAKVMFKMPGTAILILELTQEA